MSPLWRSKPIKQLLTSITKPSPKQKCDNYGFAQSRLFCQYRQITQSNPICDAIKGISLFISRTKRLEASMTVEAAVVLPLFLFFFLNLGSAIELIRLHGNLEFALCDIGNRMAVYGYALSASHSLSADGSWWSELKDIAFSGTYVRGEIVNCLGKQYLEEAPIANGISGLQLWESEIFDTEDDCIEIIVTYEAEPFGNLVGFGHFRMANRYYGHLWNGYRIPGTNEESGTIVYVTENGAVYHEDRNCSHILLSIRKASLQEAYESCNAYGEQYRPCMRCDDGGTEDSVYITDEGDRIHYREDCPGLKRTVSAVSKEEAAEYQPCGRCVREKMGKQNSKEEMK